MLNQYEKAASTFLDALAIKMDSDYLNGLGFAYSKLKQPNKALAAYNKAIRGGVQALSGAGAADTVNLITELTTGAGAAAVTLADGTTSGQIKIINHIVDGGGTATVTPTTFANGTTIAFDAVGESVTLVWNSTVGWVASSVNGATVS